MATLDKKAPTGGKNRTYVFDILSDGSASSFKFQFDRSETSSLTGDILLDSLELTLASKIRDENWLTFKQEALSRVNLAVGEQVYEDGSVSSVVNVPSDAKKYLVAHLDGDINGKTLVNLFLGILTPDTGNVSISSGALGDTPVKWTAVPAAMEYSLSTTLLKEAGDSSTVAIFANDQSITVMSFGVNEIGCAKYQSLT